MTENNETAAEINVLEVCGADTRTGADGIKLNELILSRWEMAKTVGVDFTGVTPSVAFLDEAVGRLIVLFKKEEIIAKLKTTGLSAADKAKLNGVVVNRYHAVANAGKTAKRSRRFRPA